MTDNDSMKGGEIDNRSLIFVVLQAISYYFNFPLIFETLEKYSLKKYNAVCFLRSNIHEKQSFCLKTPNKKLKIYLALTRKKSGGRAKIGSIPSFTFAL